MEKITLTTEEMNKILTYLSKQPYLEVVELINMVHSIFAKQKTIKDEEA